MLDAHQTLPRMFNLEGIFLGFLGGDPKKPKSIALETDQEQLAIQLPKELRPYIGRTLKLGDRLRCIGCSQIDFKAGVIKLQAYQILSLSPASAQAQPIAPPPQDALVASEISPEAQTTIGNPNLRLTRQHRTTILMCHKSGCRKRGGEQLATALEIALQERHLQKQVTIQYTGCQKRCSKAPSLTIMPGNHHYDRLNPNRLTTLIEAHFCPSESNAPSCHVDP